MGTALSILIQAGTLLGNGQIYYVIVTTFGIVFFIVISMMIALIVGAPNIA